MPSAAQELALIEIELAKRKATDHVSSAMRSMLFDRQREVWDYQGRTVHVLGSRRSGKSTVLALRLIETARTFTRPGYLFPYIAKSRKNAKLIVWQEVKRLLRKFGIDARVNESDLTVTFANNCLLILGGCSDRTEVDNWYGLRCGAAVVDECHTMPWLDALISVLRPSLSDVGGPLYLSGNPGLVWHGAWFERTGPQRSHEVPLFSWDMFANPTIPLAHAEARAEQVERGWQDDTPEWLIQYRGQWALDHSRSPFPFDPAAHSAPALPQYHTPWWHVLGVDVGVVNATGFCLWAYHHNDPHDWIVKSERRPGLTTGQVAEVVRGYLEQHPNTRVVMDTGGMGKAHAVELTARYGVAVIPAAKVEKQSAIRVFSDRIRGDAVRVLAGPQNDAIRDDMAVATWNDHHTDIGEDSHDPTSHLDVVHAALYGHREMRNWLYSPAQTQPTAAAATADRMLAAQQKRYGRNRRPLYDR